MTINAISSNTAAYTTAASRQTRTWVNPAASAALDSLDASDWQLGSAAAGHELDKNSQIQPLVLWQIANARQSGELSANQPVTADWLQKLASIQTNQDYVNSIDRAITYLESSSATSTGTAARTSTTMGLDRLA